MGPFRSLAEPRSMRILLPVGLALAAFCAWEIWKERGLMRGAESVQGTVLSSDVESYTTGSGTNRERQYRPVVRFRYRFRGESYEASRVTPLNKGGSRGWAEELAGRYEADGKTRVWVPPDDPDRAFLVKISAWKPRAGLAVGLLIAAACAIGLWRSRRRVA